MAVSATTTKRRPNTNAIWHGVAYKARRSRFLMFLLGAATTYGVIKVALYYKLSWMFSIPG